MSGRRLKHFKDQYRFKLNCSNCKCNEILYESVDECIHLEQSMINKNHKLSDDIKKIEKEIVFINTNSKCLEVELKLHIHHYSKMYFDFNQYISKINTKLEIPPYILINEAVKPKETTIPNTKQQQGAFSQ